MKLQIYNDPSVFDTLCDEWNALLRQSYADNIFLTLEWQQTWWQAYHPGKLGVITGRTDDGELVGIAPWFIEGQTGQRTIRTVGCVEVSDYLDVIVRRDDEATFLAALADWLVSAEDDFDLLNLCNIPEASPTLRHMPALLEANGFEVEVSRQEVCPVVTLPTTWNDYVAGLQKKQRHELRRKLRRTDAASETVASYIVGPEHDLPVEMDKFLELMAASNEEKAGFLQDEQNIAFFQSIVPLLMERGWLQLKFLTVDGEAVAAYLNFDYDNRIFVYNSGQNMEHYGHLSPGIVLLAHIIRHAIENERAAVDFLRGDERYKYHLGGQDTEVFMLMAKRAG